jgi:hypothetical protein
MNRFQQLLEPDLGSPGEEQERAARLLPGLVEQSRFRWWTMGGASPTEAKFLVLLIVTWSHYDLALLDVIEEQRTSEFLNNGSASIPVYVGDLGQYQEIEQLTQDIPTIHKNPRQTPVAALWEDGGFRVTEYGYAARNLLASVLGISAQDLNEQVAARVPHLAPASHGMG